MNEVLKALADPTRRKVLQLLNEGEKSAGELASQFKISAPSMSHHFNVLKSAGLVTQRREAQQIFYSLNTTVVQEFVAALIDLIEPKSASVPHGKETTR